MRHFPAVMNREESAGAFARMRSHLAERGWAIDADGEFAGFAGLAVPRVPLPFMPCTEVLWRLRREFWGRSVAHAAALQALAVGFDRLQLPEIVSFTSPLNVRSIHLMERLGFLRDPDGDFEHPSVPAGHPIRPHVLYRLPRARFAAAR